MDMDFSVKDKLVIDDLLEKVERYEMAHGVHVRSRAMSPRDALHP